MSDRTIIGFLGDESGSMGPNQQAMVDGFNQFIGNVRKDSGDKEVDVVLGFFDLSHEDSILRIKRDEPLRSCKELSITEYNPYGSTPLNDATIQFLKKIKSKSKNGDKVLVVIYTDGYENASEADTKAVSKAVAKAEKRGWEFIYLGANQDAWAEGGARGIAQNRSYSTTATPDGVRTTMKSVSMLASSRVNLSDDDYKTVADATSSKTGGVIPEKEEAKS